MAAVQQRARDLRDAGHRLVDFSIGDPREPTPTFVRDRLIQTVPAVSQYPVTAGLPRLRQAIAAYVERRFGVSVDPVTQVLATSGSKEAIFSSHLAFVDRDSAPAVIWPEPGYPVYERGAKLAGAVGHPVDTAPSFRFEAAMVTEEVWEQAAMVWTCSPNNPTGVVMTADDLDAVIERARATDTWLCADECYADIYEENPPTSVLQRAGEGLEGVLSFLSLSKRSGMTGYRSGAIVGDARAIEALTSLRTSTGTASPEFVQEAAVMAWADDEHVAERREIFAAKRKILRDAFEPHGMSVVGSQAGIYLWVDVGDDMEVTGRLLDAGIVVSPGRIFGAGGAGHIRLALVPALDECQAAADAVVEALAVRP